MTATMIARGPAIGRVVLLFLPAEAEAQAFKAAATLAKACEPKAIRLAYLQALELCYRLALADQAISAAQALELRSFFTDLADAPRGRE